MALLAAYASASFVLQTTRAAQVRAGAAAACHTANHRAAAISETHLDDDAVLNLERLLPSDFAVPVYFTCGER